MSAVEKLLAIASLGQKAYGRQLLHRLLTGLVVLAGLTIVASLLAGAMVLGGFYLGYIAMLQHGVEPQMAMLLIVLSATLVIAMLLILMFTCVRRIRQMPQMLLKRSSLTARASDAFDAFVDGLLTR